MPRKLKPSYLKSDEVLVELQQLEDACATNLTILNRKILDAVRHPTQEFVLLRGVGLGSPHHDQAVKGVALTDSHWLNEDYAELELPPASYWSDPGLKIAEAFQALDHAFGGDHPQKWEEAQQGIILTRSFRIREVSTRPSDEDLMDLSLLKTHPGLPVG